MSRRDEKGLAMHEVPTNPWPEGESRPLRSSLRYERQAVYSALPPSLRYGGQAERQANRGAKIPY